MTEKLFYKDSYISQFEAVVIECVKTSDCFKVILDKTAFFPEGGGQKADTGFIGDAFVSDVQEDKENIYHFTDKELTVGETYSCKIDWDTRFKRMQQHTGEHIVSGIVKKYFGYTNVGFHMEEDYVTVDFDGELNREQLDMVETIANESVYKNYNVKCWIPEEAELVNLDYRSKLELTENVRIVEIENTDLCACCAPHVNKTGEIGVIKILDFMRHRGGIRLVMKSGYDALMDYRNKYTSVYDVSNLLSAKQTEVATAVERLQKENENLYREFTSFKLSVAESAKSNLTIVNDYSYYIACNFDSDMMRELANFGMDKTALCIVASGDDNNGYSYIVGSKSLDLKAFAKAFNTALQGRGGGRDTMIQGKFSASANEFADFVNSINIADFQND